MAGNVVADSQVVVTDSGVRGLRDLTSDKLSVLSREALREYSSRFAGGRDVPLPDGVKLVYTTDLALAAWWHMRGVPVVGFRRNPNHRASRNQSVEFVCADYKGSSERQALAFVSSEAAEHDSRVRILKREAIRVRDGE